jgi:hypothetical protein
MLLNLPTLLCALALVSHAQASVFDAGEQRIAHLNRARQVKVANGTGPAAQLAKRFGTEHMEEPDEEPKGVAEGPKIDPHAHNGQTADVQVGDMPTAGNGLTPVAVKPDATVPPSDTGNTGKTDSDGKTDSSDSNASTQKQPAANVPPAVPAEAYKPTEEPVRSSPPLASKV